MGIKLLIISRSRFDTIADNTIPLFPEWVEVLVPESEKEEYGKRIANPLLTVPDEVRGLGQLRNWILDNFDDETVVMIDDDISIVYGLSGEKAKMIEDPEELVQIIINDAVMAKDLGCKCFGFSQADIRKYKGCEPFSFSKWVGCVIGVIGRKYRFRNDKFKVDIDFCLQNLLVDRILFVDNRYYFAQKRDTNKGGNSAFRTKEDYDRSKQSLIEKWKGYLIPIGYDSQEGLRMKVQRRQRNVRL